MVTPIQCKAARELLKWSQDDLVKTSKLAKETIGKFEREIGNLLPRTLETLKKTFEEAGIEFLDNESGIGVILKRRDSQERS